MIKVLIADNQPLTREGIKAVLSNLPDIEIVGQTINLAGVVRLITGLKPHELIIDHGAGSIFEVADIKTLLSQFPGLKLLVLSNAAEKDEILSLTDAGIINYIFKGCTSDDLVKAVYATAKGEKFFCDNTLKLLQENDAENELAVLSTRESEIVQFIAAGMTNKEIADKLFLSIHTIKTHRKNIIKKLGFTFKNAADLVDYTSKSN